MQTKQICGRHGVGLLGIGCQPVLVKGNKEQSLGLLGDSVRRGEIRFPQEAGPIHWPASGITEIFQFAAVSDVASSIEGDP